MDASSPVQSLGIDIVHMMVLNQGPKGRTLMALHRAATNGRMADRADSRRPTKLNFLLFFVEAESVFSVIHLMAIAFGFAGRVAAL